MGRLIVVSNRLPVRRVKGDSGTDWALSPGGLVSALHPILQREKGCWVGWAGFAGPSPVAFEHEGIELQPIELSQSDLEHFYHGFCNSSLWPLYHDCIRAPTYRRRWWWPYVQVNTRYAEAVCAIARPGDTIWVHDYQLQLVPGILRRELPDATIGFFLHVPFPPIDLFAQLPWRRQLIEGLLGADLIGFQTRNGAQNFSRIARRFTGARGTDRMLELEGRQVEVDAFPISIDVGVFQELAERADVRERAAEIRASIGSQRKLVLGVDRLDYTKGIDRRLDAFETLLGKYANMPDRVAFIQIAVPTRESVNEYAALRTDIEQLAGRINGAWGEPGHSPVHYFYRSLPTDELVSYYLAADVMAVTPFRDGMNLVAKEFCAARLDNTGVLVLSEFAGAAVELSSALLVNPHDVDGLANTLERGLEMPDSEAKRRMSAMRRHIRANDVFHWAEGFLGRTLGETG